MFYSERNNNNPLEIQDEDLIFDELNKIKPKRKKNVHSNVISTKNIIVQKVDYEMCDDNYYWNIHTVGSGDGFFITNGKAVPIKWTKSSREAKTKYMYEDGQEIEVNDGRTYIELQINSQQLTIK